MTLSNEQIQVLFPEVDDMLAEMVRRKVKQNSRGNRGLGVYQSIVNKIVPMYNKIKGVPMNPNDHVLLDGEKHAVFKDKNGALVRATFAGPGTHLKENLSKLLARNDYNLDKAILASANVSNTDKVALAHDIRYALATTPEEVRDADTKFVNKLREIRPSEGALNTLPSIAGVSAKVKLEDALGDVAPKFANLDPASKPTGGTLGTFEAADKELRSQGFGDKNLFSNQYKCDCGSVLRKAGKPTHEKTNKHQKYEKKKLDKLPLK